MKRIFATIIFGVALACAVQVKVDAGVPLAVGGQTQDVPTLAPILKNVTPGVVNIAIKGRLAQEQNPLRKDPSFRRFFNVPDRPAEREIGAAGSGVIVDAREGFIVTNNHVVERADEIVVTLTDGRRLQAKRIGGDSETDVALIKIQAENLTAIPLGDSDKLEVGDFVVAIGNPFGIGQTATSGIVSGLRRSGLGIESYEEFIQTDAAINPGNSGGPLINLRGELVGINAAIVGPSGGNVGVGFAIPVNMVREVMGQLVKYGEIQRGQLGIAIQDLTPDRVRSLGLPAQQLGAVIAKVEPGSAAERAGLKSDDVITAVNKAPVRGAADLRIKVGLLRVGDAAELAVLRGGRPLAVRATVKARAQEPRQK